MYSKANLKNADVRLRVWPSVLGMEGDCSTLRDSTKRCHGDSRSWNGLGGFPNDGQQNSRCPSPDTWPPLLSLCRLTVSVFVCDIHLTVFDGLIFMIYFEYNGTSDHDKEEKKKDKLYHMQNGDFMLS